MMLFPLVMITRVLFYSSPVLKMKQSILTWSGQTPEGLKELREMELRQLRGDGTGLRMTSHGMYNYETYNPDKGIEYIRPTL
ncbi:linoleate 13S-lipoxygenase 3-1 chloroplastic-like [Prunus yedoensis var. nudiflora]|uniref:Linoleate 13S-lipoxygenase 3-1 chloroplastic-like n=1 Tax=Prunus yedoensis var. nudiflora TaxID=2094558 RepID=A0A314UCP3_PRUYE|nr:linoleate 13S-lipoxygenase 3-1 chloroplastic-like [Prunus yedoensis var. nudiflora]